MLYTVARLLQLAGLLLLPIAMAARFQESALLCRADSAIRGPADLAGRRVGVRAYSQTTGMWLRGLLADDWGVFRTPAGRGVYYTLMFNG